MTLHVEVIKLALLIFAQYMVDIIAFVVLVDYRIPPLPTLYNHLETAAHSHRTNRHDYLRILAQGQTHRQVRRELLIIEHDSDMILSDCAIEVGAKVSIENRVYNSWVVIVEDQEGQSLRLEYGLKRLFFECLVNLKIAEQSALLHHYFAHIIY
jgi:hypothetical protein